MTLEQILGVGYIVAADEWLNAMVHWDGKTKFEIWCQRDTNAWGLADYFSTDVKDIAAAKLIARKRLAKIYDQMEQFYGEAA